MYDRILKQMREKIQTRQYVMTIHAEEEMTDDNPSVFDKAMICDICGQQGARVRHVSRSYGRDED